MPRSFPGDPLFLDRRIDERIRLLSLESLPATAHDHTRRDRSLHDDRRGYLEEQ
jgi:hypothetical protein